MGRVLLAGALSLVALIVAGALTVGQCVMYGNGSWKEVPARIVECKEGNGKNRAVWFAGMRWTGNGMKLPRWGSENRERICTTGFLHREAWLFTFIPMIRRVPSCREGVIGLTGCRRE